MTLNTWWLFTAAVFLLSGTPGPNMLHVLSRSVEIGWRRSVAAMAGCLLALILILAASAAGLTTLLLALPGAFEVLRYAGVAYLVYLGIKAWRSRPSTDEEADARLSLRLSSMAIFRGGFTIGASNPKLILFAAAFLPQFVDSSRPQALQFALLVATFAVVESFWYAVYALGGRTLSGYLAQPSLRRVFDRITGTIFIGFGLVLLRAKPA